MRHSAIPGTVALALLFLLAPWAELKLGVGAVGIGLVASRVARGLSLDRRVVAVAAGSLLWVSYALTPFWMLPTSGGLRTTAFALTVAGILGWVRLAGTPIRWRPCGPAGAAVIVVCALLAGLNIVEQDEREVLVARLAQCVLAVARDRRIAPGELEVQREAGRDRVVVFDNQDPIHHDAARCGSPLRSVAISRARRSRIRNAVSPGLDLKSSLPR